MPRLISQLFESEIFVQIGDRHFQIPRDIFSSPGDSPNFFTLGFAVFFASPDEVFPGLDRNGLLRPPAIVPPSVPSRSGDVFAQLLHLLRGYPLHIRDEDHRTELLRDCRYFHLRGLEQKLIPHQIAHHPIRNRLEIVLRLEDIRPSGLHFDISSADSSSEGWVRYARPFVDNDPADLIVEIGHESTLLDSSNVRAELLGLAKARMVSLAQVVASKMNRSTESLLHPEHVTVSWDSETHLVVDGECHSGDFLLSLLQPPKAGHANFNVDVVDAVDANANANVDAELAAPPAKRKRIDSFGNSRSRWIVRTGQWRLRVQSIGGSPAARWEMALVAVKLDIYTHPRKRNQARPFLSLS